ncbi:uroporphyrinogen-III synthase [bacterium]|nr:MAG: uroporphyrinogen-III synthase [bacterium]
MGKVWITRSLQDEERIWLKESGILFEEVPAIEVILHPVEKAEIPHSPAWVFTSQHAVDWVKELIDSGNMQADWLPDQWFAIGQKTAKAIRDLQFEPIMPDAAYGGNLATLLDTYKVRSVLHLTGNLARPELAQACLLFGINYHAIQVYQTKILKPEQFPTELPSAIAFLSPSAVEGFTSEEKGLQILKKTNVFAIGKTTQDALFELGIESRIPEKANFKELMNFIHRES